MIIVLGVGGSAIGCHDGENRTSGPSNDARSTSNVSSRDVDEPSGPALRVASWNLQAIGRSNTQARWLKSTMRALDAGVVALQEIGGEPPLERMLPSNRYRTYVSEREDAGKRTGFAIDGHLDVQRHADVTSLAVRQDQRHGVDVTVRSQRRALRLLSVHLNAGCRTTREPKECQRLREQAEAIASWIETREARDETYLVLGDFNIAYDANHPFWQTLESSDDNMNVTSRDASQDCRNLPSLIDHVIVDGDLSNWGELVPFRSLTYDEVFPDSDPDGGELSDHCPVYVDIALDP